MFVWLFCAASAVFRPDHAVSLDVVAPWYEVGVFDQVLCYMIDISQSLAEDFLKRILGAGKVNDIEYIWNDVKNHLSNDQFSMAKAKVELGFFLPRIEMYREAARECDGSNYRDLFSVGDGPSLPEIPRLTESYNHYETDLRVNGDAEMAVYANLHIPEAANAVMNLINSGHPFCLRPIGERKKFGVNMRGFGFEMRPFKYSMEYSVKDAAVNASNTDNLEIDEDITVSLAKENPNATFDMSTVSNFGEKFAGFIGEMVDDGADFFELMRDVSGNYALFMEDIANARTDSHSYRSALMGAKRGSGVTFINSRFVRPENLDVFTVLDIIEEETSVREMLENEFNVTKETVNQLMKIRLNAERPFVIDYESPSIFYYNDIEKDERYGNWSDDLENLYEMSSNALPQVRKNLLNLVIYADPSTAHGLSNLVSAAYFVANNYPVRIGVVPHFNLGNKLSRKVAYAFHHIARKNRTAAVDFLLSVIDYSGVDSETGVMNAMKEEHFAAAYGVIAKGDYLMWHDLHQLYEFDSMETQSIVETNTHISNLGLNDTTILLNGKMISFQRGMSGFEYECKRMIQIAQQMCRRRRITALKDLTYDVFMHEAFYAVPAYNWEVTYGKPSGIGLMHKSLSQQRDFMEWIGSIKWTRSDEDSSAFYILFSQSEAEVTEFLMFAKEAHIVPGKFAVNPPMSERIAELLGVDGTTTLIANGRVFNSFDFAKLRAIDSWSSIFISKKISALQNAMASMYFSCIMVDWMEEGISRGYVIEETFAFGSSLIYGQDSDSISWDIVMNPLTRDFQRIAEWLNYFNKNGVVNVRLCAVPPVFVPEIPTNYYRTALRSDKVIFTMLNDTTTYSVMPDMPDSWIVESMKAVIDLDNVLLSELSSETHRGTYVLTNIKSEGLVRVSAEEPAGGIELALYDSTGQRKSDTVAMTKGYWQLSAHPGKWNLELGGKRSKMIYSLETKHITVHSFAQKRERVKVSVNEGMEGMKVYNISVSDTSNATSVNVFSVASGHLYERLLKIMMLAVRKQSKHNVKFWIIKAFLSPQFKATLPIMAKKYNFTYELVSYKWPTWLRPQVEKQRIIWGNKILFLDVLFPLDLDRVIYVDSDQIVRTDLIELMRMDFHGAPYAFTPFCEENSRNETKGFRFWDKGYWKSHLGGKKYHISALFAIDLPRFRQMAAGDWLRHHYQELSADGSSLANLDQDLPNYAQMHIPIYSLPQEWLWCETWCTDESMSRAKTIDLCNNPLTKAPKLSIAQTRVAEWPALDAEARGISAGPDDYESFFFSQ